MARSRVGESSTDYLSSEQAPVAVHQHIPHAKIIAVLGHPVDRAYSNYLMNRVHGIEPLSDFEAALSAEERRRQAGWPRKDLSGSSSPSWVWMRLRRLRSSRGQTKQTPNRAQPGCRNASAVAWSPPSATTCPLSTGSPAWTQPLARGIARGGFTSARPVPRRCALRKAIPQRRSGSR